jgi:hypothetical protein
MMAALRADAEVLLIFLHEHHLGAAGAFQPQRIGAGVLFGGERERVADAIEPAHVRAPLMAVAREAT